MSDETIRIFTNPAQNAPTDAADSTKDPTMMALSVLEQARANREQDEQRAEGGASDTQDIAIEVIEGELTKLMRQLDASLSHAVREAQMESVQLSEVEVAVALSASGKLGLVTWDAGLAGTTSFKLKFTPKAM